MSISFLSDPELRQAVAGSSPDSLLRQPSFWGRQRSFLMVIGFSIASFFVLAPYTYQFAQGWGFLTIAVQFLALWGAIITATSLARLDVEAAIVNEIELRAAEHLSDIKSGRKARVDLDRMEEKMVPDNPSIPPPAMIRLFQHICKEAKDRKFESSVNVIQSYREEPLEDIFKLQNLQKIALWLGILGTFVGLLLAIQAGNLTNSHNDQDFVSVINQMFEKLFISFSASLAGLEAAVVLGFFILLLRKVQQKYFQTMESAVVTMLSLARNSIVKDDFLAEFGQINTTVGDLSDRVFAQTKDLSERIVGLQNQIKHQTDHIQTGINELSRAHLRFDGFLKQISDSQRLFIDDIRSVYDVISLKDLGVTLQASVVEAGRQMADTLNSNVAQISGHLARFNGSIVKLDDALQREGQAEAETWKRLEGLVKTSTTESSNAIKLIVKQVQDAARKDADTSHSVKFEIQDLSRKIADLSKAIDRIKYFAPRRRGLWEFITSLRW